MSMPFLSNFWQWPAAAVHKKTLGAVLFRSEFKSLSDLVQHRTLWPARSEVGRCRPMCVRVSAVVTRRRVDPLMGRIPLCEQFVVVVGTGHAAGHGQNSVAHVGANHGNRYVSHII